MKKAKATEASAKSAAKAPARAAKKKAASKPAKKATTATKKAATKKKTATAKKAASAAKTPAAAPAVASTPAPAATEPAVTTIEARIDVGFGNTLYIRGEGPGLSWEHGVPMDCESSDAWTWSTKAASRPFPYKVLINDEVWCAGEDFVATVGQKNTVVPTF